MIKFKWHEFSQLSAKVMYDILALRSEVFVVEQNCSYQDADGKDFECLHLLGREGEDLTAYARLFSPNDLESSIVFGRVVVTKKARSKGYGKKLINEVVTFCDSHFPNCYIHCSAQHHLIKFYTGFGFKTYGDVYDEVGIPHIRMKRDKALISDKQIK